MCDNSGKEEGGREVTEIRIVIVAHSHHFLSTKTLGPCWLALFKTDDKSNSATFQLGFSTHAHEIWPHVSDAGLPNGGPLFATRDHSPPKSSIGAFDMISATRTVKEKRRERKKKGENDIHKKYIYIFDAQSDQLV